MSKYLKYAPERMGGGGRKKTLPRRHFFLTVAVTQKCKVLQMTSY